VGLVTWWFVAHGDFRSSGDFWRQAQFTRVAWRARQLGALEIRGFGDIQRGSVCFGGGCGNEGRVVRVGEQGTRIPGMSLGDNEDLGVPLKHRGTWGL